jgi:hypothetical protein
LQTVVLGSVVSMTGLVLCGGGDLFTVEKSVRWVAFGKLDLPLEGINFLPAREGRLLFCGEVDRHVVALVQGSRLQLRLRKNYDLPWSPLRQNGSKSLGRYRGVK